MSADEAGTVLAGNLQIHTVRWFVAYLIDQGGHVPSEEGIAIVGEDQPTMLTGNFDGYAAMRIVQILGVLNQLPHPTSTIDLLMVKDLLQTLHHLVRRVLQRIVRVVFCGIVRSIEKLVTHGMFSLTT